MPVTCAPFPASASERMPPPQPMSTTSAPASVTCRSTKLVRAGLIWCSVRNSPSGSHQREASAPKRPSSTGSELFNSTIGVVFHDALLPLAQTPVQSCRVESLYCTVFETAASGHPDIAHVPALGGVNELRERIVKRHETGG